MGTTLFPLPPCLFGRKFQIPAVPSSLNGSPSTYLCLHFAVVSDFPHLFRLPSCYLSSFNVPFPPASFLNPSLDLPIQVTPVLHLESHGRSTTPSDPSLLGTVRSSLAPLSCLLRLLYWLRLGSRTAGSFLHGFLVRTRTSTLYIHRHTNTSFIPLLLIPSSLSSSLSNVYT